MDRLRLTASRRALRKCGTRPLIWATLLFAIGLVIAFCVIRKPKKSAEPATWAQTILGAMAVWVMMALGYGMIPHEWITFGNSYLNFNTATFMLQQEPRSSTFDITRDKSSIDVGATVIYGDRAGAATSGCSSAWQKRTGRRARGRGRRVEAEPTPIAGGGPLSPPAPPREARRPRTAAPSRRASESMARNDANPPMPEFSTSYVLQEVDPKWLTQAVKPKQFLHIDQAECILCEGCVDICPWKCIHMLSTDAIDEAVNADQPGDDPKDHVFFVVDEDVCTRCALCVDRCPTGVIILGKVTDHWRDGDPNDTHQPTRLRLRRPLLERGERRQRSWPAATETDTGRRSAERLAAVGDKTRASQAWNSIFRPGSIYRKGYTDSPRNRSYVIMNNVLYHLHPVKVKRHAVKVSYTLCLGGLSFFLFILLTVTGIFLMFFYRPTVTEAYANVQNLETAVDVRFTRAQYASMGRAPHGAVGLPAHGARLLPRRLQVAA